MKLTPFYLISLTFIGLADALYLSYYAFVGKVPSCTLGGCSEVLTSTYSKVVGVPLAYYGTFYYLVMLALAVWLIAKPMEKWPRVKTLAWATIGLLCSASFVYIQGVLIGHYCMYCLISAATTVLLFFTALWHFYTTGSWQK